MDTKTKTKKFKPAHWLAAVMALPDEPTVRVIGYAYVVDMGRAIKPRLHTVHKNRVCNCGEADCPAISTVADWLAAGRIERAPEPPEGYMPFLPENCPVCNAKVVADHTLSSRRRGIGWRCAVGGTAHYYQHRTQMFLSRAHRREWLFPPVAGYAGVRMSEVVCNAPFGYLPACNH